MRFLISMLVIMGLFLLGSVSFAGQKTASSAAQLQKEVNQEYKDLLRLYKQKAYNSYLSKSKDVMVKLNNKDLPVKYRQKMSRKVIDLNVRLKNIYNEERLTGMPAVKEPKKKLKKKETVVSKPTSKTSVPPSPAIMKAQNKIGSYPETAQGREQETEALREAILKESPQYRQDPSGLASRVMEHKIRLARERHFLNEELQKGVEKIYQQATDLYQDKNFTASYDKFSEVEGLWPGYKKTRDYLQQLDRQLLKNKT